MVWLDPYHEIKNVNWGPGIIASVELDVSWDATNVAYTDHPTIESLPFTKDAFELLDKQIVYPAGLTFQNPFTNTMMADGYMWSYAPYKNDGQVTNTYTVTITDQCHYYFRSVNGGGYYSGVFTYSTVDGVTIPGGPFSSPAAAATQYFEKLYNPYTFAAGPGLGPGYLYTYQDLYGTTDPALKTHQEQQTSISYTLIKRAIVFINVGKIKALYSLLKNPPDYFQFDIDVGKADAGQTYDFTATVTTWQKKKDFPVDSKNNPTNWVDPNDPTNPISSASQQNPLSAEVAMNATINRFEIDLKKYGVSVKQYEKK